jgi:hypothetical protein
MMNALARQLMMARPTYLTPLTAKCSSASADGADLPEAGAPEVEITPAMIKAGINALPFLEPQTLGSLEEGSLVSRVYLAMHKARVPRSP